MKYVHKSVQLINNLEKNDSLNYNLFSLATYKYLVRYHMFDRLANTKINVI